jgi:hypothetical protein
MQRTFIHVAWSNGRWRVTESGPPTSNTYFGERRDAMDYVAELAQRAGDASSRADRREANWSCGTREAVRNRLPPGGRPRRRRPNLTAGS